MQFFQKNDDSASPKNRLEILPLNALAKLVLLGEEHSGRDEMNLSGNPFALLQASSKNTQNVLCREFERTLPDGRVVMARWEVAGHPKMGLPGPTEELLLLVLMQLTREAAGADGVWPRTVYFSRFALLNRLGWPNTAQYYRALGDGFTRLANVTINARYAFFDAGTKLPIAYTSFGLLDSSDIVDEPRGRKGEHQLPLSSFTWSERMHGSFLAGNVRSLALEFVLRLELPLSRRLFRFLDSMRWAQKPARRDFSIGVMNLRDRLGMTPYAYPSKVKEKLARAHEELQTSGYLAQIEYRPSASGEMLACYLFGDPTKTAFKGSETASAALEDLLEGETLTPSKAEPFSSVQTLVEWDMADDETRGLACDAVFKILEPGECEAIDARIWEAMPPFLRDNRSTLGARTTHLRERRKRIVSDYGDRVRALLDEAAQAEVASATDEA